MPSPRQPLLPENIHSPSNYTTTAWHQQQSWQPPPHLSAAGGRNTSPWVKEVEKSEAVGVIVFHGLGGDYSPYPPKAHQQLVDYRAAHRAEIWTAPLQQSYGLHG